MDITLMSCCGICGRSEFHLLPPVSRPPSHSPPLFPVGWVVSLQPFISIHKQPNIAPLFSSFSPPVVSSEIVPSWEVVTWFHFCKPKSYCCPVSRSVCSHSQAGGKVVPHRTEIAEIWTKKSSGWLTTARLIVPVARFSAACSNLWISTPALSNFHPEPVIEFGFLLLIWRKEPILARGGMAPWLLLFANLILARTRHPSQPLHVYGYMCPAAIWHPSLLLAHLIIPQRFLLLAFVLALLSHKGSTW